MEGTISLGLMQKVSDMEVVLRFPKNGSGLNLGPGGLYSSTLEQI